MCAVEALIAFFRPNALPATIQEHIVVLKLLYACGSQSANKQERMSSFNRTMQSFRCVHNTVALLMLMTSNAAANNCSVTVSPLVLCCQRGAAGPVPHPGASPRPHPSLPAHHRHPLRPHGTSGSRRHGVPGSDRQGERSSLKLEIVTTPKSSLESSLWILWVWDAEWYCIHVVYMG